MNSNNTIETGARLAIIEQAGLAVATLTETLERDELLRSRLTRAEVLRQLSLLAGGAAGVGAAARARMPEIDWPGWEAMCRQMALPTGEALDEALWFACESLVPATLLWLRVHRTSSRELFQMTL